MTDLIPSGFSSCKDLSPKHSIGKQDINLHSPQSARKEEIFNSEDYQNILDIKYTINKKSVIQEYSNATVRFSINIIIQDNQEFCFYSNPEITIF